MLDRLRDYYSICVRAIEGERLDGLELRPLNRDIHGDNFTTDEGYWAAFAWHEQLWDEFLGQNVALEDSYPTTLRASVVILGCTRFESWLGEFCKQIKDRLSLSAAYHDMPNRKWACVPALSYLKKEAKLKLDRGRSPYTELSDLYLLRNALAHEKAVREGFKDKGVLIKFLKKGLIQRPDDRGILLHDGVIDYTLATLKAAGSDLLRNGAKRLQEA